MADVRNESGAVSTEYLFLMVFVALAIVLGAVAYGATLGASFAEGAEDVDEALEG